MRQPFDVSFYPFDYHTITFSLDPEHKDANLTNCASPKLATFAFTLSSEWWLDMANVDESGGVLDDGACTINIGIRRNPAGVVVSHLVPCFCIVGGGLGAMWLDPSAPPSKHAASQTLD